MRYKKKMISWNPPGKKIVMKWNKGAFNLKNKSSVLPFLEGKRTEDPYGNG